MEHDKSWQIPLDASEIFEDIEERDAARKRAIDIARQKADEASSEADRAFYANLAATMSDIRFELHELFPENFPEDTAG